MRVRLSWLYWVGEEECTGYTGTQDVGAGSNGRKSSDAAGFEEKLTCWKWFPVSALLVAVVMSGE